ncbi:MAG TPA: glutamate-cysteine ligase family protein [Candidatus Nanoarchaeia archaeon]|nr:glutamate-cysteine ligase family protein [Candidatus Nanoarchaeia archaeon]
MEFVKHPLKKSMTGFEVELFTINKNGFVMSGADRLLKISKRDKKPTVKKESTTNIIEIASYPGEAILETTDHLLKDVEYLTTVAEKEDILLCPLGTYPGKFNPVMRDDRPYKIKEYIFGKNKFKIAGRCTGFHCHYTLPRGIFDSQLRILKMLVHSKIKDSLVNSYNFLIAADPALTALMQSSPFYQGEYIGKDSRVIVYRGGDALNNKNGLYANFEEFGGLPPYKLTALDILDIITTRYEKWKSYIKSLGLNIQILSLYGSVLDTTWNPVKINPNGTLEQRGMDMNHPAHIAGIGVIIKSVLRKLQEEFYTVVQSDIGIKEPFKVEKDIIYIPPWPTVRNELQKMSAYKGMDNDLIYEYCKRFIKFAQSTMPKEELILIEPFKKMLNERKTVSDEILDFARKRGFRNNSHITNNLGAEIALEHSRRLLDEITSTKNLVEQFK